MPTLVGGDFSQGNVTLEDLILEGVAGPGQDHIIHTQSFGWKIDNVYTFGGTIAGMRIAGSFHHISRTNVDQAEGMGIQHDGVDCRMHDIYVSSPDEEAIHYTFVSHDNIDTNIKVAGAWAGGGTGPAIMQDGVDNMLDSVRVRANGGATWAIAHGFGALRNRIGVAHLDAGTLGKIDEIVLHENEIYDDKRALHFAYFS